MENRGGGNAAPSRRTPMSKRPRARLSRASCSMKKFCSSSSSGKRTRTSRKRWFNARSSTVTRPSPSGASPTPNPVMLRTTVLQPLATLDFFGHASVLDLPDRTAFLHVLQLSADLLLDLLVLGELTPQRVAHLSAKHEVFSEDLVHVRGVHQHFHQLIEQVVDRVLAQLDLALFGDQLANAVVFGLRQPAGSQHFLRLVADFLLVANVLVVHRRHVEADLLRGIALDVARCKKHNDHFGRNLGHLRAVKPHAPLLSYFERELSRFRL